MARTFRRRGCSYDHAWILRDRSASDGTFNRIDPQSRQRRRALARYHCDATVTLGKTAPRWYRKVGDRRIRMHNRAELNRWLRNPDFDPVFQDWHKHEANWSWW